MPELWYDIEKAYFLDVSTGQVVKRFVVFRSGVAFDGQFETYEDAESYVTRKLTAVR